MILLNYNDKTTKKVYTWIVFFQKKMILNAITLSLKTVISIQKWIKF